MKDRTALRKEALAAIKKKFGADIKSAAETPNLEYEVIPTGSIGLNHVLGIGGYPKGRVIEIYGKNASGKTSLALHAIAESQKEGGLCAFVDAENTFDKVYAASLGVDLSTLDLTRPENGEEALEIVDMLAQSSAYDLIVVDSVAALVPAKELEGEMGKSHIGLQARLMSQALRKLTSVLTNSNTCLLFINQTRDKVGVLFGSPTVTSGGNALPFYTTVRLSVARIATLKDGDDVIGNRTKVTVVKNKCAGTAKHTVEFDMFANNKFGSGISLDNELFEYGLKYNLIEKAGAWYSINDEKLGQGKLKSVQALRSNPELFDTLKSDVIQAMNPAKEVTEDPENG